MSEAKETGQPVVATAMTDERTLVTADPTSGAFVAELTAGVARVRDGAGGWRAPSSQLVMGVDGLLHPMAAVAQISISNGGSGSTIASISDGTAAARFTWPESLPSPVVDGDTATYAEVYPGVDLVARAGLEDVETYLVVKNAAAAKDGRVRSWSMPVTFTGVTVKTWPNGANSLMDSRGAERLRVSPARMWDSTGKASGLTRASDRVGEVDGTRSATAGVKFGSGRMTVAADPSFFDDPHTVYPVVIDPQAKLGQTHVLRVTDDWTKWDSAVGDHGKLGFNGWTAPYYRSRMFYQFAWPTNAVLTPATITKGVFEYVQDHSPQHSPCKSTSTAYPGIRAKLANVITSSDTWSDRTGDAWHPQASVISYMAVGHEDYCNDEVKQTWNLTGALQTERANYAGRTTVTVGLYSDVEDNAMGWRHYLNNGSSPKLTLTYQGPPQVPTNVQVSNTVATVPNLVTSSVQPKLSATVNLEAGGADYAQFGCSSTTSCMRAEFAITGAGTNLTAQGDLVKDNGATSTATLGSALLPGTYSVAARTCSTETTLCSLWTTAKAFVVNPTPAAPSLQWVTTSWSSSANPPANTPLQIQVARGAPDGDITEYRVKVTTQAGSNSPPTSTTSTATLGGSAFPQVAQIEVGAPGGFGIQTSVSVEVRAWDGFSESGPATLTTSIAFG